MSKIENLDILNYINDENIFTEAEREMFMFLLDSIPENMINIQEEGEDGGVVYRENKELLTLITVLSSVLGNSRELVLNLEKSHDLPQLIRDIKIAIERDLDPAFVLVDSDGNPEPTLKYERLGDSNKRLLAILVEELGFEVDFNQITRDVDNTYLKELETYFNLIVNQYETVKNRGSNSALYQILRYYNEIDTSLGFPTLEILEQGETDDKAPESSGLEVVPTGSVRMHLTSVPEHYAKLPGSGGYVGAFDPLNSLFYLDSDTELYRLIMGVKPAGIFYEMVVKATFYLLYTTDRVMASRNSYIEQEGGFRLPLDIQTILNSLKITYTDNITEIENIKAELKINSNINYDTSWKLDLEAFNSAEDETKTNINRETNRERNRVNTHNLDISTILEGESIQDLKKALVEIDILDSYDYNNKDTKLISREIPEVVKDAKLELGTTEGTYTHGESFELLIDLKNNTNRQQVKEITTVFEQRDEYANKDHTFPKQTNVAASGERQLSIINNTDKIWRGTLKTEWLIERENESQTITKTITKTIPLVVKDKFSRGLFTLFINDLTLDSNYGISFKVVNPNNKAIDFDLGIEWSHNNDTRDTYKELLGVSVGADSFNSYDYSITDSGGLYGNIGTQDRAKAKKVKILVEPLDEEIEEYPAQVTTALKNPVSVINYTPDQSNTTKHVEPLISGGVKVVDVATKVVGSTLRVDYIKNYLEGELKQRINFTDSSKKTNYIRLSNTKVHETDGSTSTAIASFVDKTLDNTDLDGSGSYNLDIVQDLSGSEFIFKTPILGGSPGLSYFLQSDLEIDIGNDAEPKYYSGLRDGTLNTKTITIPTLTGLVINDFWIEAELYEGSPRYIARVKVSNNSSNTYDLRGKYYESGWQDIEMPQLLPQTSLTHTVWIHGIAAPPNNINRLFVVLGDLVSGHSDRNEYLVANSVWDNLTRVETLTLSDPEIYFRGFTNTDTEFRVRISNPNTVAVNYRYYMGGTWTNGAQPIGAGANLDLTLDRGTTSQTTFKAQFIDVVEYNNSAEISKTIPKYQRLLTPQITYVGTTKEVLTGNFVFEVSIYNPNSIGVELYTSLGENETPPWNWQLDGGLLDSKQSRTVTGQRPNNTKNAFDFFSYFKTDNVEYYDSFMGEIEVPLYEEQLMAPTLSLESRDKTSATIRVTNPNSVYGDIHYILYSTNPGSTYTQYEESVGANTYKDITIPIGKDTSRKLIIKLSSTDYKDSNNSSPLSIGVFVPPQLLAPIMTVSGYAGQYYKIDVDNPNDVPALLYLRVGTEGPWEDTIEVYPGEDLKNIELSRHTHNAFTVFARYGDATPEQDNYANSEVVGPFNVGAVTQLLTPTISSIQRTQTGYSFLVTNPNNEELEIEYKEPGDVGMWDGGVVGALTNKRVTRSEGPSPAFNLIARLVGSPTSTNSEFTAPFQIPKPDLLTPQVEYVSTTASKYTIKVTNTNQVPASVYFRYGEGVWSEDEPIPAGEFKNYTLNRLSSEAFTVSTKFTSTNTNESASKTTSIKAYVVLGAPIINYVPGSRTQNSYQISVSNTNAIGAEFLYGLNGGTMNVSGGEVGAQAATTLTLTPNTENAFTLKGFFETPGDGYGSSVASTTVNIPQYVHPKLSKPTLTFMVSEGPTYVLKVDNPNSVPVAYHNKKGTDAWQNTGEQIQAQGFGYVELNRTDLAAFTVRGKFTAVNYTESNESDPITVPKFVPTKLTQPTLSDLTYTHEEFSYKVTNPNNVEVTLYAQVGTGGYSPIQTIGANNSQTYNNISRPGYNSFDMYFKFDDVAYWEVSEATKMTIPKAQLLAPTNVYTFNEGASTVGLHVINPNSVGAEVWVSVDDGSSYSYQLDIGDSGDNKLMTITRPGGISAFNIRVQLRSTTTHLNSPSVTVPVSAYTPPKLTKPDLSNVVLTGPTTYTVDIGNSNGKTVNIYYRQGTSGNYVSGGTVGTSGTTLSITRGSSGLFTLYVYFTHTDNTASDNSTINVGATGTWTLEAPTMTRVSYTNTHYNLTIQNPNPVAVTYSQKIGSGSWQTETIQALTTLNKSNQSRGTYEGFYIYGKFSGATGYEDSGESSVHIPIAQWTVTFYSWTGAVLKTESVSHGGNATPPPQPNPGGGYDWAGWSGSYTNVTSNRTITATRTPSIVYVTITWQRYGGSTVTDTVEYGQTSYAPSGTPDGVQWEYAWPQNSVVAYSSQTITENRYLKTYTISWSGNGGTLSYYSSSEGYGTTPTPPSGTRSGYTLTGWSPSISSVTGNASYSAVWTATAPKNLRWVDKGVVGGVCFANPSYPQGIAGNTCSVEGAQQTLEVGGQCRRYVCEDV